MMGYVHYLEVERSLGREYGGVYLYPVIVCRSRIESVLRSSHTSPLLKSSEDPRLCEKILT